MNVHPMPRDWHQRASWRAKQQRRDALRRLITDLARERVDIAPTVATDPDGHRHTLELGKAIGAVCADCNRPTRARGLCSGHYKRRVRAERKAAA